jgi:hypothetical protein
MKCGNCDATGCKMWREYQTFTPKILCAPCAAAVEGKDISTMDDEGRYVSNFDFMRGRRTYEIGWYVPCVPDTEGNYWGYGALGRNGIDAFEAWIKLPSLPEMKND